MCWCSRFFSQRAHAGEFLEPNSMVHPLQTSSERNVSHKKLATLIACSGRDRRIIAFCPRLFHHSGESFASTYSVRILGAFGGSQRRSMMCLKLPQKERTKIIDPKTATKKSIQKHWEGCFDWNNLEADTVDPLDFLGVFLIGESLAGCYVDRSYHDLNGTTIF